MTARASLAPEQALEVYDPDHGHGPWGPVQAAHLLRRAVGGARPGALAEAVESGPAATLEELFADPDPVRAAQLAATGARLARGGRLVDLQGWWLMKLVEETRATGARLALFWHGHFATAHQKVDDLGELFAQHQAFVASGAGSFGELARAMVRDPALLRFLDADRNRRGQPNENLARELLELFTLGVGAYSEQDVVEGARALTGYTVGPDGFRFVLDHHDREVKQVLGRWIDHGEDLVDAAVIQPACPRFLIRRLWSFYVGPEPGAALVDALAHDWREHDLDVTWLLRRVLSSRAFFAADSLRSLVRSPVDLAVGLLRRLGARPDYVELAGWCERMGQRLFDPPGVQGWAGGEAWIHAASWLERMHFAGRLADGGLGCGTHEVRRRLRPRNGADPGERVDHLCGLWLQTILPASRRRPLLDGVAREDDPDAALLRGVLALPEVHLA